MAVAVGQVADPVVGQFRDERVTEGRPPLDVEAERREVLGRDADEGDVADADRLEPGLPLLPLLRLEDAALIIEDLDVPVGPVARPLPAESVTASARAPRRTVGP
jgi:hypothetical protein